MAADDIKFNITLVPLVILFTLLCFTSLSYASLEVGVRIGYDSNVNQSVQDEQEDSYLSLYLSYNREPTGEARADWFLAATLTSTAYKELEELNYSEAMLSPGIAYFLHPSWRLKLSPFVKFKIASDSDRSAIAYGGKVAIREKISDNVYLGQYYIYTNSLAKVDTYSFTEHAVGIYGGANLTSRLNAEIGYEYSQGYSFRGIGYATDPIFSGRGRNRRFSGSFNEYIVKDKVDSNMMSLTLSYDISQAFSTHLGYTYTITDGELGKSKSHTSYIGFAYGF